MKNCYQAAVSDSRRQKVTPRTMMWEKLQWCHKSLIGLFSVRNDWLSSRFRRYRSSSGCEENGYKDGAEQQRDPRENG
jgi:hypothetical protein